MKIKTILNVITNSSSETFVIRLKDGVTAESFCKFIRDFTLQHKSTYEDYQEKLKNKDPYNFPSGCGGFLQVFSWKDMYCTAKYWHWDESHIDDFESFYTVEDWVKEKELPDFYKQVVNVDMDSGYEITMRYLWDNYEVLANDFADKGYWYYERFRGDERFCRDSSDEWSFFNPDSSPKTVKFRELFKKEMQKYES